MGLFIPEVGLVFWMLLAFVIVVLILGKFGWPVIVKSIDSRNQHIAESLQAAEEARQKLINIQTEGEAILAKASSERTQLLKDTKELGDKIIQEAKTQAQQESEKMLEAARAAIEKEKENALKDIRNQVVLLSIDVAEKVLRKNLENQSEQAQLVNKFLDEINVSQS